MRGGEYMYFYNANNGTLHIIGYCTHSKGQPDKDHLIFETEVEAEQYAGGTGKRIHMCKICQKKRDKMLKGER